jgi:hypothetical protein
MRLYFSFYMSFGLCKQWFIVYLIIGYYFYLYILGIIFWRSTFYSRETHACALCGLLQSGKITLSVWCTPGFHTHSSIIPRNLALVFWILSHLCPILLLPPIARYQTDNQIHKFCILKFSRICVLCSIFEVNISSHRFLWDLCIWSSLLSTYLFLFLLIYLFCSSGVWT